MDTSKLLIHMTRIAEVFLVTVITLSFSQYSEDGCDWLLWDAAPESDGIRTIKPSCVEGFIQWKQPYGAVRLVFTQQGPFELCFIAKSIQATIQISKEESDNLKRLILLTDKRDGKGAQEVCVQSGHEHSIGIYVESVLDTNSGVGYFDINYDLKKEEEINIGQGMQECRPCTDNEIVHAACYSDFVVKGKIEHVMHRPDIGETEVYVALDKVHRQVHNIFKKSIEITRDDNINLKQTSINNSKDTSLLYRGHIIVPHKCRTSKGDGKFVLMGKVRLKRAHLNCAPRYEDFTRLWKKVMQHGANMCILG